jgi:hypothetical protein
MPKYFASYVPLIAVKSKLLIATVGFAMDYSTLSFSGKNGVAKIIPNDDH